MEKRRAISRVKSRSFRSAAAAATSICPSSPSSGGESPTTMLPRRRKPFPETPCKVLRKQHSAEDLHIRGGLWPSAKNQLGATNTTVITATLQDHLINDSKNEEDDGRPRVSVATHAASTFSSRQRATSDSPAFEINTSNGRRGRRHRPSLSSIISNRKKPPGTPPSPSSSSSSSSFSGRHLSSARRLPANDENALARRRSEFGLDIPSTESDRNEPRNLRSRAPIKMAGKVVIRRSGSPARKSKSPVLRNSRSPPVLHNSRSPVLRRPKSPPAKGTIGGGMGNIISMGLGSLFRRKSYSGAGATVPSTVTSKSSSAMEPAMNGTPSARRGMVEGVGSPARGAQAAVELQHELRMAQNHLMQWRFLNGRTAVVNTSKWTAAQVTACLRHVCNYYYY